MRWIIALAPLALHGQILSPILFGKIASGPAACGSTYSHCASISVPSAPSTLTDFPNVVAPLSQWAVTGSGGQIQHTVTQTGGGASITVPADFVVTSDSLCTTAIPFEWETYVSSTGTGSVLWVKTTRATGVTTTIYACWGSSGTTYLGNVNGTWLAAAVRVWHLPAVAAPNDSTSSACNGALSNAPTDTTGQIDGGTNFVAASSQEILFSGCNMPTTSFSLSAWVNIVGGSTSAIVGNASNSGVIEWRVNTSNTQDLLAQQVANVGTSNTAIGTSAWHHVAVTYDKVTARFYLDGVADGTPASTQAISQGLDTTIGGTNGDFMNGKIDELEVYNDIRSADWISALHSNQATPITPSVIQ